MLVSIEGIYENGKVRLLETLPGVVRARVVVTLLPEPLLAPLAAEPGVPSPSEPKTGDPVVDDYRPRTDLGRELIARRRAHIRGGGRLVGWDEIEAEVAERRGGIESE